MGALTSDHTGYYKLSIIGIGLVGKVVDWLYEDIEGKWDYSLDTRYVFFEHEEDAVAFKLTWY